MYGKRIFLRTYPDGSIRLTRKNMLLFVHKLARRIGYIDAADSLTWLIDIPVFEENKQEGFWERYNSFSRKKRHSEVTDRKFAINVINALADALGLK